MLAHLTQDFFKNRQSRAIGLAFIAIGLAFGSWASFIPTIKEKFSFSDAELGLLLLCMPFGSLFMNPVAAYLVDKFGMQKVTVGGMLFLGLAFMGPLNAINVPTLGLLMFACGSSITILNIAMNTCVTALENHSKINIMSTCHGMFSVGLLVGSVLAGFAKKAELLPGNYILLIGSSIILGAFIISKTILALPEDPSHVEPQETPSKKFSLPKGALLLMIIISLCVNMTEGTMADWTAVYMREIVDAKPFWVSWGLVGYSFFMALGRLLGDSLVPKFGANKILIYGGLLSLLGIIIALVLPSTVFAILGFSLVGAGVSCCAPILYGSAARLPNMKKGAGLAIMNTFAMGGFLFGPVIIGFVSDALSLPMALSILIGLAAIWVYYSKKVVLY